MKIQSILLLSLLLSGACAHAGALLKPTSGVTQALRAKNLDVKSDINGAFARTTVTTIYDNPNDDRIEADFIYSAPAGSVVTVSPTGMRAKRSWRAWSKRSARRRFTNTSPRGCATRLWSK